MRILYRIYKAYVCFVTRRLLYRRVRVDGWENLPEHGEPTLIISNHQNAAMDALALVEAMPNHMHPYMVARGDVFWAKPWLTKFFLWIGMLPAFRLDFEGGEALEKNADCFAMISQYLRKGDPVCVFPNAAHMRGHYLGDFTTGYLKMALQAAADTNWEKDIRILPAGIHYTTYSGIQGDQTVRFGQPISLQPYYQDYQEHPYPTLRKLNKLCREKVQGLMVDLGDEHPWALDWVRTSALGEEAVAQVAADPESIELAQKLSDWREKTGIEDNLLHPTRPGWSDVVLGTLALLILFPAWVVLLWPHLINYALPPKLKGAKTADYTWDNSYRFVLTVVALLPIEALLTLLVLGLGFGWWWQAVAYILMWTTFGRWAAQYWLFAKRTYRQLWVLIHQKEVEAYEKIRCQLKNKLE